MSDATTPLHSPATPNEAQQQARARAQQLARSFLTVFGREGSRTASQRLVIEHLERCAGDESNAYQFNGAKDGVALVAAGIHRDGAQSITRIIKRQISIATELKAETPKPAVKVKR